MVRSDITVKVAKSLPCGAANAMILSLYSIQSGGLPETVTRSMDLRVENDPKPVRDRNLKSELLNSDNMGECLLVFMRIIPLVRRFAPPLELGTIWAWTCPPTMEASGSTPTAALRHLLI